MGIINTTPDSFSDGGEFASYEAALAQAFRLIEQGADILDIGGESTRPGATGVSVQQEMDRVVPLVEKLRSESDIAISIDTYKPEVMSATLNVGADMINDINGLRAEGAIQVVASAQVPVCVMHMQGQPQTMQASPSYQNVVGDVIEFLQSRLDDCLQAGMDQNNIVLDPGIGFGKTLDHNLLLLRSLPEIRRQTGCELLLGISRKSLIDKLFGRKVTERLPASLGLAVQAVLNGARIIRAHDVRATFDAIRSVEAVGSAETR